MTLGMVRDDLRSLFESLYAGTPDAVGAYDREGLCIGANAAATELTGVPEEGLVGHHFSEHVGREDVDRARSAVAVALGGGVDHIEMTVRHVSGAIVPAELYVFPARREGVVVGFFAQVRDIVALRSAERWLNINQDRFRSLFEFHPDGILELKDDGTISRVNMAFESETGFLGEQVVGRSWTGVVAPEFREIAEEALRECKRGEATEADSQILDRLGNRIDVALKLVPATVGSEVRGAYAIARNITAQRDAERAIAVHGERIRDLYLVAAARGESAEDQVDATIALAMRMFGYDFGYVCRFDGDGIEIRHAVGSGWNVRAGQRYPREQSLTRHVAEREVLEAEDLDASAWADDSARENAPWRAYVAIRLRVGDGIYGALAFAAKRPRAPLSQLDRDLVQMAGLFVAAALERIASRERIEALAFTDAVTGLPNRVLFDDRIRQTIAAAKRYDRGFSVMYLDVDHFKRVNDDLGHAAGDEALKALGARLRETLRESDTVARFGGDEFAILQPIADGPADAADLARKIVAAVQRPIGIDGGERAIHVSIGIALYPQDATTVEELMALADRALYAAKRAGRNRWTFANEELVKKSLARNP